MKYATLIEADTELEAIRLDILDELMKHIREIKTSAESILGTRIYSVKPVGHILCTSLFDEGEDIHLAFFLNKNANLQNNIDPSFSSMLNSHFGKLQIEGVGTICAWVFV